MQPIIISKNLKKSKFIFAFDLLETLVNFGKITAQNSIQTEEVFAIDPMISDFVCFHKCR